jgi:ABC-type multidrug transport system fused ATPase/permease subunit
MLLKTLFIDHFKDHTLLLIIYVCILMSIYPLESVLLSRLFSKLFDSVNKSKNFPNFSNIYDNIKKQNAPGIIIMISCVYILLYVIFLIKNYFESIINPNYQRYLRTTFFNKVIYKYSTHYKDIKIGEVLSKIVELNYAVMFLFSNIVEHFLQTFAGLIVISFYFLSLNKDIGLIYISSILLIILIYGVQFKNYFNNSVKKMNLIYNNNEVINDKFNNLMNIYLNNEEKKEIKKFYETETKLRDTFKKNINIEKQAMSSCDFVILITTISIIVISYYYLRMNKISSTNFVSIVISVSASMIYLYRLNRQMSDTIYYYSIIMSNKNFLTNLFNDNKNINKNVNLNNGKIEFKKVYFKYNEKDDSKYILKNFNYVIQPKTKIALLGQSGSGKSTIMKLLIHLYPLNKGQILIDNEDIKNIDVNYLRTKIIYVNQKTLLFNDTILNNIKYGTNKSEKEIIDLINTYDLNVVFQKLPFGLKSNCGVNGNHLSLGMQKVIITLRGILKTGIIYIFDEPLTSLDAETKKKIIKMLFEVLNNKTIIIITHDKEILPHMDKVMNINQITQ